MGLFSAERKEACVDLCERHGDAVDVYVDSILVHLEPVSDEGTARHNCEDEFFPNEAPLTKSSFLLSLDFSRSFFDPPDTTRYRARTPVPSKVFQR